MEGGGVELLGDRLVTLVDSGSSMTRRGTREHLWQMRWQYTFNHRRVWGLWAAVACPGAARLAAMADRRLALCSLMLGAPPGSACVSGRVPGRFERTSTSAGSTTR